MSMGSYKITHDVLLSSYIYDILFWIILYVSCGIIWSFCHICPEFYYNSDWFCFSLPSLHIPKGYGSTIKGQAICIIIRNYYHLPFSDSLALFEPALSRYRASVSLKPSVLFQVLGAALSPGGRILHAGPGVPAFWVGCILRCGCLLSSLVG